MIKLESIKKYFKGTTVLQNVNVTFENGKKYAIIGFLRNRWKVRSGIYTMNNIEGLNK